MKQFFLFQNEVNWSLKQLKSLALFAMFLFFGFNGAAQVTTNSGSGLAASYLTLSDAITALNSAVILTPVTISLSGNETAPSGGYVITAIGTASNTIVIEGVSSTITAFTPQATGTLVDGIFKLVGADFVTLQNFTMQENAANLTVASSTNNMTEFGVALLQGSATKGSQNNTIQNNTISLNRLSSNTFGIYSNTMHTSLAPTVVASITTIDGSNSNNKIYANTISNVDFGIFFNGAGITALMDTGNDVGGLSVLTGNTLTNYGGHVSGANAAYVNMTANNTGIFMNHQINENVSYNSITGATNISTLSASGSFGILKDYISNSQPTGTITANYNHNTISISNFTAVSAPLTGIGMVRLVSLATATINCNNNTLQNFSNGAAATTGQMTGLLLGSGVGTLNVTNNIIKGFASSANGTGSFFGIQQQTNAVINVLNISDNKLGDGITPTITFSRGNTAVFNGIAVLAVGAASTCAITISNNDIRGIVHTLVGSGAHNYISNTATVASQSISNNTFTNLNVNTTGAVTFISQTYAANTTGTKTVHNNSIVTGFTKSAANGTVILVTDNGSSVTGSVSNCTNNNFSNITVSGTSAITGLNFTDGGTAPTRTVTGNTLNNWTAVTGAINAMNFTYWNGVSSLSNNTITNLTGQRAITGVTLGNTIAAATSITVASNTINNLSSTGVTGGAVNGIVCSNTSTLININDNTLHTLSCSGAFVVNGISITGATATNVFKNKIYNLLGSNASSTVNGIAVSGGTTVTLHNNYIADLRTPSANAANPLVGINVSGGTSVNVFQNTVYLNGTSLGALFGSSALLASTSPTLNLRNNILVNTSTPNGAAFNVTYRRSSTTLSTYANTSNNNLFYAGTPSASNLIFYDGTNSDQSLTAFKSRVTSRDNQSVTENIVSLFLSTVGSNANFLHIDPAVATQAESGGAAIVGLTLDFDGDTRNATTPDIGADEFTGILLDLTAPIISYTNLGNVFATASNTFGNVTITDFSGFNTTAGTKPRVYFKKSSDANDNANWKFVEANGTTSPFDFTIDYSLLTAGSVTAGDIIQYFVVAQDLAAPTVGINSGIFATAPTSVALGASQFPITGTINSYIISAAIAGTKTVCPSGCDYASLSAIGGAFESINNGIITANVTLEIASDLISETGLIALNEFASPFTLTIKPTGAARLISGTSTAGIISLNAADNVIIDGALSGISRDLTITNTNSVATSFVIGIQNVGTNGASSNIVKNCNIIGNASTTTLYGILSNSTGIGLGNNNNSFLNNNITKVQQGIASIGSAITTKNNGTTISQNQINGTSPNNVGRAAIRTAFENNIVISNNDIANVSGITSADGFGITCGSISFSTSTFTGNEVTNATITNNKIDNIKGASTFGATGIFIVTATNSGTNLIANNSITNTSTNGTTGDFGAGILVGGGAVTTNIYFNSISMNGTTTGGSEANFAIAIGGSDPKVNIRNNIFSNSAVNGSGNSLGKGSYAIGFGYATFSNLTINNNDYFASGTEAKFAKTVSLTQGAGTDIATLAAWQTAIGQDVASINLDPSFTSSTNLLPTTCNLNNKGKVLAGVSLDITGATRGTSTPDIGAYEIDGVALSCPDSTDNIWSGASWSLGTPVAGQKLVFVFPYSENTDLTGASLEVRNNAVVQIPAGFNVTATGPVVVTSGSLTFKSNSNLIQTGLIENTGNITVERNTAMQRLAYTFWGSPVAAQNLLAFSPLTSVTPTSRFYTYSEPTGAFVSVTAPSTTNFTVGTGYSVRAPNTFADAPAAATAFTGTFTGVPNNGTITVTGTKATTGDNLIGNPYPCAINAIGVGGFITTNPSTLYFWTKSDLAAVAGTNYASQTSLTGTAAVAGGAAPNGIIQVGQGFFCSVAPSAGASSLVFNNAMKVGNNADQFFRNANTIEKHLIKFNLTTPTTNFNQIAVGYMTGATNGVDAGIDGLTFGGGNPTMISSLINGVDYVIQGKALPFTTTDVMPLGFKAETAGSYTISTADTEGVFAGSQEFYLKDNLTNTTHNIKQSPYNFVSGAGTFNSRFQIVYQTVLGVSNPTIENGLIAYVKNDMVNIKSTINMTEIKVFDLAGRLVYEKSKINTKAIELNDLKTEHQMLLIQITADGKTVTKKIVY